MHNFNTFSLTYYIQNIIILRQNQYKNNEIFYILCLRIKSWNQGLFTIYSAPQFGQDTFQVLLLLSSFHVGRCGAWCPWEKDKKHPLNSHSHKNAAFSATEGV